jgi:hypothetical protein
MVLLNQNKEMTMKIKQIDWDKTGGTSLQGYVTVSYDDLVEAFGKPDSVGDGYKTDAEWNLEIDDTIVTIYNYKNGRNYNGAQGLAVDQITDWHVGGFTRIGGFTRTAVDLVEEALFLKKTKV